MSFESCDDKECPACELGRFLQGLLDADRVHPYAIVPMTVHTLAAILEQIDDAPELFISEVDMETMH